MFAIRYIPTQVAQLKPADMRISVLGKVVEVKEGSFILDDGSGKVEIAWEGQLETGKLVRAFCSRVGDRLTADVIQHMEGLDLELYKKVRQLYERAGV